MQPTKRHTTKGPIRPTSLPVASQKCPAAPGSTLGGYCGSSFVSEKDEHSIGSIIGWNYIKQKLIELLRNEQTHNHEYVNAYL